MTKTVFKNEGIVIEELPQTDGALVKADSEVLIQTPSEMSCEKPFEENEATDIAIGEYKTNFDQLWLSTIGSSVATGANVFQAIKNDGTLYRLVNDVKLNQVGKNLYEGLGRNKGKYTDFGIFEKVGGTTAAVASQVFAQGMLIQISFQLAELQTAIEEIRSELFKDKIRDLKGSSQAVLDAICTRDKITVATSISAARRDFTRLRDAIDDEIKHVNTTSFTSNWYLWKPSVQSIAEKQCSQIGEGLNYLLYSVRIIATGYAIIDQQTGQKVAFDLITLTNSLPLAKLQEDLRILPYEKWQGFEEYLQKKRDAMQHLLQAQMKKPVFILSGHEIHALIKRATNGKKV